MRLVYEAARLAMRVRGLKPDEASLGPDALVDTISYFDGRPVYEGRTRGRNGGAADAPLAVFLHGLGSSVATWAPVLPQLSRSAPLVAPDLPGFGRTPLPHGTPYATLADQVDAASRFLDAVSPERPVQLVGQSLGGWIAATLAADRPDRVSRLTLVNSAGILQPQVFEQRRLFSPTTRSELRRLWRSMWHTLPRSYYLFERHYLGVTRTPVVRGFLDSVGEHDFLNERLPRITAPTLLLWGLSDRLISYESVGAFRAGVPDIRVRLVPECGHVPQRERPEEFLRYVVPWLQGQEPPESVRPGLAVAPTP